MLRALNQNGEDVLGWDAAMKGDYYFCPECKDEVIFKLGRTVTPHFAHKPGSTCAYAEGESAAHLAMKATMARFLPEDIVQVEVPMLPGHRADLLVPAARIVIECQASKIQAGEWERRTRDYNRMGYAVLWVWDIKRFGPHPENETRVPDEIRLCHKQQWGRVYVLAYGALYSAHLETIMRPGGTYYNRDGEEGYSSDYYPKSIRKMLLSRVHVMPLRMRRDTGPDKYMLVNLGDEAWWKQHKQVNR